MGHEVTQLKDYEANEDNLYSVVENWRPELCFFAGHGSGGSFTTMNLQPLLVACRNDGILAGSGSLFISCLTGIELVPSIVSKGGLASAGFTSEFTWVVSEPYDPFTDPYWKPFERMLLEGSRELLRGNGWRAWYDAVQRVGREEEAKWGYSTDPLAPSVVYALRHDYSVATYVGEAGGVVAGGLNPLIVLIPLLLIAS